MYDNVLDLNRMLWSMVLHGSVLDGGQHLEASDHTAEHGVELVEVRALRKSDVKLASVRVGPRVRHRHRAPSAVGQPGNEFVGKGLAPNAFAALPGVARVARLADKALDHPVELAACVLSARS